MPSHCLRRRFLQQVFHKHGDIQHVSAKLLFSCIVSIFMSSGIDELPETSQRKVLLHTDAKVFANHLLDVVEQSLHCRRPNADLWPKLAAIAELMVRWFFPDRLLGHRTCAPLEIVLAVVFASRGLVFLRSQSWTQQTKRICRLLGPGEADVLLHGCPSGDEAKASLLNEVVNRQRLLIEGPPVLYGLYQWWSECWRYVGIGKLQRQSHVEQGGLSRRFMEHMLGTMRASYRDGHKLRYRLARRTLPWASFFLVCATGSEPFIRACELVECKTHQPRSNGVHVKLRRKKRGRRRRPDKHSREKCSVEKPDITQNMIHVQYMKEMRSCSARAPARGLAPGQETSHADVWSMQYKQAYIFTQHVRRQQFGVIGPLDIHAPSFRQLLLLYLCVKKCLVNRDLADKYDRFASMKCAQMLQHLPKPGQRQQARRVIDEWLARHQFASTFLRYVKLPHAHLVPYGHRLLGAFLRQQVQLHPTERKWLASRVRFCVGKMPTFKDDWNHVKLCKQETDHAIAEVPRKISGQVARIDKNWQVEKRMGHADEMMLCQDVLWQELAKTNCKHKLRKASMASLSAAAPRPLIRRWKQQDLSQSDYEAYTAEFQVPDGVAIVPDDKAKKVAWIMPAVSYILLCMAFADAADSWKRSDIDMGSANDWLCNVVMAVLGAKLASKFRITAASWLLPYSYASIKEKCWQYGLRVCFKKGHSCVRKIVSYARWERKLVWRSVHRAWDIILKSSGCTCDVWSLNDASARLKRGLEHLCPNHSGRCHRCSSYLPGCAGVVADAGQFFEVVGVATAIREARELLDVFAETHDDGHVSVLWSRKKRGWIGGKRLLHTRKGITWHISELLRAFVASMSICFTSMGSTVFQLSGLPIGGLLSKVAACITLGGQERRWKRSVARRIAQGFGTHQSWNDAVLHLRFTDDVVLISKMFCRHCLADLLKLIYSVDFDVCEHSSRLAWLDMCIDLDSCQVGLHCKSFCPPPHWSAPRHFLRSILLGRFSRWRAIDPPAQEWQRACLLLLHDLRQASWPSSRVLSALFSINNIQFIPFVEFARAAWKLLCSK